MAQTVHLKLQIDGNDIEGESTIASMEREGTIECSSFSSAAASASGRTQHKPITIRKRIDKSTPLLLKALCQNEPVTSAQFRFFRPSTGASSGAEEHFYTVLISRGRITSVNQLSEDVVLAGESAPPMMEEVAFTFDEIEWTEETSGATHSDTARTTRPR